MPLSYQNWKRETTTYCGNDIQVWYDANGILSLQVDYPWVADEAIEEPDQVISAEEALLVVQNKIGNVITDQNQELQSLTLRYLYRQDGDAWLLIPVWEAVIHQTSKDPDSWVPESCTYVTVDAITGKRDCVLILECNIPGLGRGLQIAESQISDNVKEEYLMKQLKRRVLSMLVLAAILVPMVALVAFCWLARAGV